MGVRSRRTKVPSPAAGLDAIQRWPSAQAKRWVIGLTRRLCNDENTLAFLAIGSIVRPVSTVQDADLLYIYSSYRPQFLDHPLDVDVRVYDGKEVPNLLAAGHDLLGWTLRYGRLICERDGYWTHITELWSNRVPLPDPKIAEARASRSEAFYRDLLQIGDTEAAQEQLISHLTHKAWARLLQAGIYPASRPELAGQLRGLSETSLADHLESALRTRCADSDPAAQQGAPAAGASHRR